MRVRSARPGDEPAIRRVFAAAGRAAWAHIFAPAALDALELREEHFADLGPLLVADDAGEIVGFAKIEPGTCELALLYVAPGSWGAGVGRALMDAALAQLSAAGCERAHLWTEERNERPRRVYERYGWRLDGRSREYEAHGTPLLELGYAIDLPRSAG